MTSTIIWIIVGIVVLGVVIYLLKKKGSSEEIPSTGEVSQPGESSSERPPESGEPTV